ncbi:MAG: hypothetical protein LBQ22_05590 [Bacteroidales bacterium]|jgi:hypothetical protein|nr:hypothetical protein [Bacteroidales bacterium]
MKGIIFKYTNKDGEEVKAVAFNDEQKPAFSDHRKAFLRLLNEDYTFKTNEEGKKIIAVKSYSDLTKIGYWD